MINYDYQFLLKLTTTISTSTTTTTTTTTNVNASSTQRSTKKPDDDPLEYIYEIDPANTSTYIHINDLKPNTRYEFRFEILIYDGKGNAFGISTLVTLVNLHYKYNVSYHILFQKY